MDRPVTVKVCPPACGICRECPVEQPHYCATEREMWRELAATGTDPIAWEEGWWRPEPRKRKWQHYASQNRAPRAEPPSPASSLAQVIPIRPPSRAA